MSLERVDRGDCVVWWWTDRGRTAHSLVCRSRGEAEARKASALSEGANAAVIFNWEGSLQSIEGADEVVSLDMALGRGRHGTPTDDGPRAA